MHLKRHIASVGTALTHTRSPPRLIPLRFHPQTQLHHVRQILSHPTLSLDSARKALFLFDDNVDHHLQGQCRGQGSDCLRTFEVLGPNFATGFAADMLGPWPRVAGVVTRTHGETHGFRCLRQHVETPLGLQTAQDVLHASFDRVERLLQTHGHTHLYFPSDTCGQWAFDRFRAGPDVVDYLERRLGALGTRATHVQCTSTLLSHTND